MGTPTYTKRKIVQPITHNTDNHTENNAYQMTSKEELIAAHIVSGLVHTSLISIKTFINAGCKVTYDTEHVKVF